MDKIKEVAKLFEVKVNEDFRIVGANFNPYKFDSQKGLIDRNDNICSFTLKELIKGTFHIEKPPFKPLFGERYHCITSIGEVSKEIWGEFSHNYYCYNAGNCFRTREEITDEDITRIIKEMKG